MAGTVSAMWCYLLQFFDLLWSFLARGEHSESSEPDRMEVCDSPDANSTGRLQISTSSSDLTARSWDSSMFDGK